MSYLRIFLLVLMAVVLPVRGAVAAAMLCHGGGASHASTSIATDHGPAAPHGEAGADGQDGHHGHHSHHGDPAGHHHSAEAGDHPHADQVDPASQGGTAMSAHADPSPAQASSGVAAPSPGVMPDKPATCHACASGCCMASLIGAVPVILPPSLLAAVSFPALAVPVPLFHSDGQDRPPRTI